MVGLADTAVRESHERIRSALQHNGYKFPHRQLIINLAPADLRKEGSAYDLPLAIGILAAAEEISADKLSRYMIMGELSLDGSILPIRGALPIAIQARAQGFEGLIVPKANVREAAVVDKLHVYGVENICEVVDFFNGDRELTPTVIDTRAEFFAAQNNFDLDFADVKGQESVKRAFEVAAAGGHNLIMIGPPGAGKSMMAKRIASILPPLTLNEALETTKIHSVAGKMERNSSLLTQRPFRAPHHTISSAALVGGGTFPQPGEISLATTVLLSSTKLPEFSRQVLEVMRQPLEDPENHRRAGKIHHRIPGKRHARRIDESLPLRVLQPPREKMYLPARGGTPLLEPYLGPVARPYRHTSGNRSRTVRENLRQPSGRTQHSHSRTGNPRPGNTKRTFQRDPRHILQRTDEQPAAQHLCPT